MQLQEIITFIDRTISDQGKGNYQRSADMEKRILSSTIKAQEEMGELSWEILGHLKLQRLDKLDRFTPETLQDEFADTLITIMRLGRMVGIDINDALEKRIKKLQERIQGSNT